MKPSTQPAKELIHKYHHVDMKPTVNIILKDYPSDATKLLLIKPTDLK